MSLGNKLKFQSLDKNGNIENFKYGNVYFEEQLSHGSRLTIGPSDRQIGLINELSSKWQSGQYYVLYVLLVSHCGREPGRYQSPILDSFDDLRLFLYSFQEFFEGDGRHHLWVASPDEGMLIYDQHNVIFAYGDFQVYKSALHNKDFTEQEFWFPAPHTHSYPPENAVIEDELFDYWQWSYSPLEDGDEYS